MVVGVPTITMEDFGTASEEIEAGGVEEADVVTGDEELFKAELREVKRVDVDVGDEVTNNGESFGFGLGEIELGGDEIEDHGDVDEALEELGDEIGDENGVKYDEEAGDEPCDGDIVSSCLTVFSEMLCNGTDRQPEMCERSTLHLGR